MSIIDIPGGALVTLRNAGSGEETIQESGVRNSLHLHLDKAVHTVLQLRARSAPPPLYFKIM